MRLQSLVKCLSQDLLDVLHSLGIESDADLFSSSGSPLDIWRRLPPGFITLQEFNYRLQTALAQCSCQPIAGGTLSNDDDYDTPDMRLCIPTVPELDELLNAFCCRTVIEVSGTTGSGKSTLALQIVCDYLSQNPTAGALWVDTTGDFSPLRVTAIVQSCTGEAAATVLERLQVALAFDTESAYDVLDAINGSVQFIVIDAITPLLGPNLSAISAEGHAVMATFVRQLRSIAQTHNLFVLVINTATWTPDREPNPLSNFCTTTRKPALGPTFTFLVDATLWLSTTDGGSGRKEGDTLHVAEVFKSRSARTRRWCRFGIRDGVLVQC